jgi:cobalt-zinc-cadmium efflux system membrane fusion protein
MNAEVEIKQKNALAITEDAVVSHEGKDYVFIAKGNYEFDLVEIKKGGAENGFIEIITIDGKDISNSQIVIKGAYSLLMQLKNKSEE